MRNTEFDTVWESLYKWEHESSILFYITQIMYMLVLKQQNLWSRKKAKMTQLQRKKASCQNLPFIYTF